MNEDLQKKEHIKNVTQYYASFYNALGKMAKNFKTALGGSKEAGLKIFQKHKGPSKQANKSGLEIRQSPGITKAPSTGLRILQQGMGLAKAATVAAAAPIVEKAVELKEQAKDAVFNKREQKQSIEQAFAEAIGPDKETEAQNSSSPVVAPTPKPEPAKDRLLYADNKIQPDMTPEDMLAISELFTAQKGDKLQGNSAKNLVVEFNGQILLKTDRDGRVDTNNLENEQFLSTFSAREKLEIAEAKSQFEELKPQIKEVIAQNSIDNTAKLKAELDGAMFGADQQVRAAEQEAPIEPSTSPLAQQTHKEAGSQRLEKVATPEQSPDPAIKQVQPSPKPAIEPNQPSPDRDTQQYYANMAAVAFNQNYEGDKLPKEGRLETPTGTVIQKTIVDEKAKIFDLSIQHEGNIYNVATFKDGQWEIDEHQMAKAQPAIEAIERTLDQTGKFAEPQVVPQRQEPEPTPTPSEPERDYDR
jgi:hypothetical protein